MFSQEGVPITGYSLFSFWKEGVLWTDVSIYTYTMDLLWGSVHVLLTDGERLRTQPPKRRLETIWRISLKSKTTEIQIQ